MFNKQTFYSINKADPNSIVYLGSDGHLLRLTSEDFSSPEEFRISNEISNQKYRKSAGVNMNNSVDHVAIKLVHIMFCKGMIDAGIYRQVLAKYFK